MALRGEEVGDWGCADEENGVIVISRVLVFMGRRRESSEVMILNAALRYLGIL